MEKIFFVEDDESIFELIKATIKSGGYDVEGFYEPLKMLKRLETTLPNLIVLDLMLPNMNGYDVIKKLKGDINYRDIPVIILSAKSTELDIVRGLDLGASDYITKPFGILEFISRIKANLHKTVKVTVDALLKVRDLEINVDKHHCTISNNQVDLTVKEYEIIKLLVENVSTVVTRQKILSIIWGYETPIETRTLDMHIKAIREKIALYTDENYIETVRGVGYIIKE